MNLLFRANLSSLFLSDPPLLSGVTFSLQFLLKLLHPLLLRGEEAFAAAQKRLTDGSRRVVARGIIARKRLLQLTYQERLPCCEEQFREKHSPLIDGFVAFGWTGEEKRGFS